MEGSIGLVLAVGAGSLTLRAKSAAKIVWSAYLITLAGTLLGLTIALIRELEPPYIWLHLLMLAGLGSGFALLYLARREDSPVPVPISISTPSKEMAMTNRAAGVRPGQWTAQSERGPLRQRWLAIGGILGPVQFVTAFTIAGLLRPGYSWVDQQVSDLGIGANAWLLNGSLIILAVLLVASAVAFYRSVRPDAGVGLRLATALCLAVVGFGFGVAGIFPETTALHWLLGAYPFYIAAPLGLLLAGILMVRGGGRWRTWGVYSLVSSLGALGLIGLTFYVFASYQWSPGSLPVGHLAGLMERLVFIEVLAWYVVLGWRLLSDTRGA